MLTWLVLLAFQLLLASSSSLWDRDEPRFARATMEMIGSGDYLVPTFNTNLRPDKPAGIYWLMALAYQVLGFTESAFRLPATLGIAGCSMLTYLIGEKLFSRQVGYWAMIFYSSSLMPIYMSTAATADGAMNFFITLSLWAFIHLLDQPRPSVKLLLTFTLALGAAQLIKGPVGLAIPLLSAITMAVLTRRWTGVKPPRALWVGIALAALLSFGMFAAWGIPANLQTKGQLAAQGLGKHVYARMTSAMESHGGANLLMYVLWLPYYVPIVIAGFTPWITHLPAGLSAMVRGHVGTPKQRAILWGWILPTFVLMTLVVTRLQHYVLPIFPALAILAAATVEAHTQGKLSDRDRDWLRGGAFFALPVLLLLAGVAGVGPWLRPEAQALRVPGGILAVTLLLAAALLFRHQQAEQLHKVNRVLVGCMAATLLIACFGLLPAIETAFKPSKPLAQAIRSLNLPAGTPVVCSTFNEPSLFFYLNLPARQAVIEMQEDDKLAAWAKEPGAGVLVISQEQLERIEGAHGPLGLKEIFSSHALRYSGRGRQMHLVALLRSAAAPAAP